MASRNQYDDEYAEEAATSENVVRTPDEGKGYIDEFSADFINGEIFRLFDVNGRGEIELDQLHVCAKAMGWSPMQCKLFLLRLMFVLNSGRTSRTA